MTLFDSLPVIFNVFIKLYALGQYLWSVLNTPIVDILGEDIVGYFPEILLEGTLLEVLFGPLLFVVVILKVVQSFMP